MAADWLNIAGGAGAGFVAGTEDNRRREEFNSLMRQRQRIEKQQKEDEALEATMRGLRPPGKYDEVTYGAGTSDPAQLGAGDAAPARSTTKKVTVTPAGYDRARADVLSGSGSLRHMANAAQLRQNAYATEEADRKERYARGSEALLKAQAMLDMDPDPSNALRHLQGAYKTEPDGHDIEIQMKDGALHHGIVDPDKKWLEPPQPVSKASVQALIDRGWSYVSPEGRQAERNYGLQNRQVAAVEAQAAAATRNAESNYKKAVFDAGDDAQKARQALIDYHKELLDIERIKANAMLARAQSEGAAGKFGPSQTIYNAETGENELWALTLGKDGKVATQKVEFGPGRSVYKDQTESQKDASKRLATMQDNQTGLYAPGKDGKINYSAIDDYKKEYRLPPYDRPGAAAAAAPGGPAGLMPVEKGNIDLKNRPRVKNADGTTSTVRTIGINVDGKEVVIPTVSEDGRVMSNDEAVAQFKKTGKHFGKFKTKEAANAFAEQLHKQQEQQLKEEPAPKEDTRKYTRSKVRGGWDYTVSTRGSGKTKAEWAAEDKKMGIVK